MIPLNTVVYSMTIHTTRTNYIITECVATMTTKAYTMISQNKRYVHFCKIKYLVFVEYIWKLQLTAMTTAIIGRLYSKITGTWRSDINVIELGGTWVWLQRFNCEQKLFGYYRFWLLATSKIVSTGRMMAQLIVLTKIELMPLKNIFPNAGLQARRFIYNW